MSGSAAGETGVDPALAGRPAAERRARTVPRYDRHGRPPKKPDPTVYELSRAMLLRVFSARKIRSARAPQDALAGTSTLYFVVKSRKATEYSRDNLLAF